MASVTFDHVKKTFGATRVLDDVAIEVGDGEFLVLVGPSGCGKSTLLRCLAGLEEVTAGTIRIGDRDVTRLAPRDRDVAMVFQSYALYPHMTVRRNMGFALEMRKLPKAEIDRQVLETAEMLELTKLLERYPKELSGGQRQRVAMGRAIVRHPQVFLFDEPLSNLDAALRTQLRGELGRLHDRLGTTMIYVTHDQVEAMTLADRIAVLNGGVLQQIGTPAELYHRPANRFVAGFIGSPAMSFLEGVEAGTVLGVRPHDVRLGEGDLSGEVDVVETLGFESYVHLRLGAEHLVARVAGTDVPPRGRPVKVSFQELHRFDPGTGRRQETA